MSPETATHRADVPFAPTFVHRLLFTDDLLGADRQVLADVLEPSEGRPARVQFWVDGHVAEAMPDLRHKLRAFGAEHAGRIERAGNVQLVPGGEAVKNDIHILERILKVFHAAGLDRRSYVVVVGGGAVLDAVGFAAAIAHRGLRLVRLPTTTLAQADSGVGVKNAVNLFGKKNWLGSFAVPWAVINDASLLETLPDRDFVCGFSEAVKVSLLKDAGMFAELCRSADRIRRRDPAAALPMIRASAERHRDHITLGGDPFEAREARPLDFGHWSAHRLEAITDFRLRHGEAVAIGVAIDTVYSTLALGLPSQAADAVLRCLDDLGLALGHPALDDPDALFEGLEEFRQHLGGRLTLTMLRGVGDPIDVHEVDEALMRRAIECVRGLAPATGEAEEPAAESRTEEVHCRRARRRSGR
ncbi:MAG TPA: 3-dehydroquinate synthase [Isosphaeraceae bacterium]|jgi:3-dehydroquinate synthase|nr:3-dehydroquinate synthase [Isosphaeraceae bacterium]